MRLYDFSKAPNPRRARMFIAEKGLDIPNTQIDLGSDEQLKPEFLAINPDATVPMLETDEGVLLSETVAIAHYLEQLCPEPPLMGKTPTEQALVLMWNNIVEQQGMIAVAEAFRNSSDFFKNRAIPGPINHAQIPALADRGRKRMDQFFDRVNQRLQDSPFLAGNDYTLADISLLAITDFSRVTKYRATNDRPALAQWHADASARPSAKA